MHSRILVAIDGTEIGERVLAHAVSLARISQSRLLLVHVLPPDTQYCNSPAILTSSHSPSSSLEQGQVDVMRDYWRNVTAAGILADFRLPCGHPGEEICELAQRWGADLILMGHRNCPEVIGLNSMSRYVLDHAPCPLMILPQQAEFSLTQLNRFVVTR
jgi:nucleotide-binding universal stress UspA family protein